LIFQFLTFVLLVVFCFEYELGGGYLWRALYIKRVDFYSWTVRITLCGAMILFDALLVLYFARIVRLYRYGLDSARSTLTVDLAIFAFVAILCCGYLYGSITSALRHGFNMDQYNWIGRFFIQISNFFYITLEVGGALLAWSFLKQLARDKSLMIKDEKGNGLSDVR